MSTLSTRSSLLRTFNYGSSTDLGHACHLHHNYWFPRKWLMELFATLCLYTYIADQESSLLTITESFFLVLHDMPPQMVAYHQLADFEAQYVGLPLENYLWFSGHLAHLARDLYKQFGQDALARFWQLFIVTKIEDMPDVQLWLRLRQIDEALTTRLEAFAYQYT